MMKVRNLFDNLNFYIKSEIKTHKQNKYNNEKLNIFLM